MLCKIQQGGKKDMTGTLSWPLNQKVYQEALNAKTPQVKKTYTSWSSKERAYLKKFASTKTIKQLAKELGKTESSITSQLYIMRKKLKKTPRKATPIVLWTMEEDKFLAENYGKMKNAEIGEKLGRTAVAVQIRYSNLKCKGKLEKLCTPKQVEVTPKPVQIKKETPKKKVIKAQITKVKKESNKSQALMIGLTILNTIILSWILFSSFIQ